MKIAKETLKYIIKEELKSILTEGVLMDWAAEAGVSEEIMYDMLMVPGGTDMMAMLMRNGFRLKASENEGMTWVAKTKDDGFWAGETIQIQFTIPEGDEKPLISYYATADEGFLKTDPFETTFNGYDEVIDFVNVRFAGQTGNPKLGGSQL